MIPSALLTLFVLVAFPAVAAWRRRAQSREDSELALELQAFALAVRREAITAPDPEFLGANLAAHAPRARDTRLPVRGGADAPDTGAAGRYGAAPRSAPSPAGGIRTQDACAHALGSAARRGAAALPAVLAASLVPLGLHLPDITIAFLLLLEMLGCFLLWRITRAAV